MAYPPNNGSPSRGFTPERGDKMAEESTPTESEDDARRESESGYQDGGTAGAEQAESPDDTAAQRPAGDG
jgi:hypothetical protein